MLFVFQAIKSVFYIIFGSVCEKTAYFAPPISQFLLMADEREIFFLRPLTLLNRRIQIVKPSLTALNVTFPAYKFCAYLLSRSPGNEL